MPNDTPEQDQISGDEALQKHFARLPKVIQDAITGAEVTQHLRDLSQEHKLHLDQWQILENVVVTTLMGLEEAENLKENILEKVDVDEETANTLARDIALNVFEPIRKELERGLERPGAEPEEARPIEDMRGEILNEHRERYGPAPAADRPPRTKEPAAEDAPAPAPKEEAPRSERESAAGMPAAAEAAPAPSPQEEPPAQEGAATAAAPQQTAAPVEQEQEGQKVKRGPGSGEYAPGKPSTERKSVDDDPYREKPDE